MLRTFPNLGFGPALGSLSGRTVTSSQVTTRRNPNRLRPARLFVSNLLLRPSLGLLPYVTARRSAG